MKLTEQQYELIEAYLNNELSATDRATFEADLEKDAELNAEIQTQRNLRMGLQALAIEQRLQQARQRWQQAQPNRQVAETGPQPEARQIPFGQQSTARRLGGFRYWAAAASVVLVLGLSIWIYQQNNRLSTTETAYNEAYRPEDGQFLTKDFPTDIPTNERNALNNALQQYQHQQYADMRQVLEALSDNDKIVPYKHYLLGLSWLADKQPKQAIPYLDQAAASARGVLKQKADWFLALAYLKADNKAQAEPRLRAIAADPQHPYRTWAQKVLKRL